MASRLYPPPAAGYPQAVFGGRVPRQTLHGSGVGLFGDGSYSGNIVQGGVTLQPQDYLLDGITPLAQCIVVTGAATVAPNAETGSAVAMGRNLVIVGASAILTASTNAKGLVLLFDAGIYARTGARIHMDKLGMGGNFGDLTAYDLAPSTLKAKISQYKHTAYLVLGEGAPGGLGGASSGCTVPGTAGAVAGAMQTGGGGGAGGGVNTVGFFGTGGNGGKGGPCSGGSGGGAGGINGGVGTPGEHGADYGLKGGDVGSSAGTHYGWGGMGNPVGASAPGTTQSQTGGPGGLVMLFAPVISIGSGCIVSADGASNTQGGSLNGCSGGSAGGGCIACVAKPSGYSNGGTLRASGGAAISGMYYSGTYPGINNLGGGAGSVNVFQNAA